MVIFVCFAMENLLSEETESRNESRLPPGRVKSPSEPLENF
jgi:hypothetical protein